MTEKNREIAERRQAAVEKALGRAQSLGIQVDTDPRFAEILQRWTDGSITLVEAREEYLTHIRDRDRARADWRALGIASSIAKARAALSKRSGS